MAKYFDSAEFDRRIADYRKAPTMAAFETLVADFILPVCREYLNSRHLTLCADDIDDVVQIAAIRGACKIDRYRVGSGKAFHYFTKIAQNVLNDFLESHARHARRTVSLDAHRGTSHSV